MTEAHPDPQTVERHHENIGVGPGRIMIAVAGLVVLIVVSLFVVSGVNRFLAGDERTLIVPSRDATTPARGMSLEPDQGEQKLEYLAEQEELLNSYGWVDREQGIARIPIEDAMRLYVDRQEASE